MTRGAGRGRRLALLGEEIYGSAGRSTTLPAETNVWQEPSISERAQSALFRGVEHDRAFRAVEDVPHEAVVAGLLLDTIGADAVGADTVGATAAVDHESRLCHHEQDARGKR